MTEKQNEKVTDYKIICFGEPTISEITVKSGANAGKKTKVLSTRAFHPVSERISDGKFESKEPLWFDLKFYHEKADLIADFFKDGLAMRISGEIKLREWTGKDQKVYQSNDLIAYTLAIELMQKGLKSIVFEKPIGKKNEQHE